MIPGARCETCRRPRRGTATCVCEKPWVLASKLRPWQSRALSRWEGNSRRGVVEAATGTGKTMVALGAVEKLRRQHGHGLRVAVVVPTVALALQWRTELIGKLGMPDALIGEMHGSATGERKWDAVGPIKPVLVAVINSAREKLPDVIDAWGRQGCHTLLIVDECHRSGSASNSKIYAERAKASLGLSATPERGDRGHELVYEGLGDVVFRYPLLDALSDGTLADLTSVNFYVDLAGSEVAEWAALAEQLSDRMNRLFSQHPALRYMEYEQLFAKISLLARIKDSSALAVVAVLAHRRKLLAECSGRRAAEDGILHWLATSRKRAIVFHETIAAASDLHRRLRCAGVQAALDHSQMTNSDRQESMRQFRAARARVLVAVRSLDEGLDVPDAEVAVIAAGSRGVRQRIQRLGRVLRREGEKSTALAVTILVRGTPEESVGHRDPSLVGKHRVRHHRWGAIDIASAVKTASTYAPTDRPSAVERLSLVDVDLDAILGTYTPEPVIAMQPVTPLPPPRTPEPPRVEAPKPYEPTVGTVLCIPWEGRFKFDRGPAVMGVVVAVESAGVFVERHGARMMVAWHRAVEVDGQLVRLARPGSSSAAPTSESPPGSSPPVQPADLDRNPTPHNVGLPEPELPPPARPSSEAPPARTVSLGKKAKLRAVADALGVSPEEVQRLRLSHMQAVASSAGVTKRQRKAAVASAMGVTVAELDNYRLVELQSGCGTHQPSSARDAPAASLDERTAAAAGISVSLLHKFRELRLQYATMPKQQRNKFLRRDTGLTVDQLGRLLSLEPPLRHRPIQAEPSGRPSKPGHGNRNRKPATRRAAPSPPRMLRRLPPADPTRAHGSGDVSSIWSRSPEDWRFDQ